MKYSLSDFFCGPKPTVKTLSLYKKLQVFNSNLYIDVHDRQEQMLLPSQFLTPILDLDQLLNYARNTAYTGFEAFV